MTEAAQTAPRWRNHTPVLCFYEYMGRDERGTRRLTDSIMIKVEFSDQIEETFQRLMRSRANNVEPYRVGPKPLEWKLLKYLTPDGRQKF